MDYTPTRHIYNSALINPRKKPTEIFSGLKALINHFIIIPIPN